MLLNAFLETRTGVGRSDRVSNVGPSQGRPQAQRGLSESFRAAADDPGPARGLALSPTQGRPRSPQAGPTVLREINQTLKIKSVWFP